MSAQKKVSLVGDMKMVPSCHPDRPWEVLYKPSRGGDNIVVKCSSCYREHFYVKLPKEDK